MPLIVPVLDDRTYGQLYAELRNRIPVYNREWTDYNDSDPAITLLQLFAYLGESLQFRFNQIPEATKVAFLRLLDLPLMPARPATALVRFSCEDAQANGAQVYANDVVKAGKVEFTVENDVEVWPLDCVAVARNPDTMPDQANEPELHAAVQATIDAVASRTPGLADIATYRTTMLAADGTAPPIDFSDTVDGLVWIAVLKSPAVDIDLERYVPTINIGFSPAAITPTLAEVAACPGAGARVGPAVLWEVSQKTLGSDHKPRYRQVRVRDATAGLSEEGVARLSIGEAAADLGVPGTVVDGEELAGTGDFPPVIDDDRAERVWFWIRAWRPDKSRVGAVRTICINAAMCTQAVAAGGEQLGSGTGQPGQVFELAHRPVIVDARHPVKLQVAESDVWKDWTQREDFDASGADDRHFVVDPEAGTVTFGARFPYIGERVRVSSYRYGGGSAGNVPAKAISKFEPSPSNPAAPTDVPRADSHNVKCGNPFKAAGGDDSESIEHALTRVPGDVRRRTRAVTRDDFRELALMTPGVTLGRAECLPLFHAPDQVSPRAGVVSVVVWPASDPVHPNAPQPDAYELRRVCEWLDTKRLVTTELYVIAPTYRRVAMAVSVKVKDGFSLDAVRDWVDLVLRQYLAPLPPYGPDGEGWPLGRRVLGRELEGVAMQVDGVEYVEAFRLAGEASPGAWQEQDEVLLAQWEVPEVAAITVVDENTDLPKPPDKLAPPPTSTPVPIPVLREQC